MYVRVLLKICEGCGSLWFRAQDVPAVYCRSCAEKLRDFPDPATRKRRGRPRRNGVHTSAGERTATDGAR
jgi:hypothetical protein